MSNYNIYIAECCIYDWIGIANSLKIVLPALINDQTGFMSNRSIGDNIRLIYDLIAYFNTNLLDCSYCLSLMPGFWKDIWLCLTRSSCIWFWARYASGVPLFITILIKSSVSVNGQLFHWFKMQRLKTGWPYHLTCLFCV